MKKILSLLLVIFTLFLTGCGSIDSGDVLDIVGEVATDIIEDALTDTQEYETEQSPDSNSVEETVDETVDETADKIDADISDTEDTSVNEPVVYEDEYYYDVENVVLYLHTYGKLPDNFITKNEARDLGWEGGSVERYLEGAAIGGDYFGNREELLPIADGRKYTECDIDTNGKSSRGAKRLVFSNDGLYFYTDDHYESFTEIIVENNEVIYK